jgi:mono/diheme cytochrome c family protein
LDAAMRRAGCHCPDDVALSAHCLAYNVVAAVCSRVSEPRGELFRHRSVCFIRLAEADLKTSRFALALCCLLFQATFFAQAQSSDGTLTANPVFKNNCAKCHGKTAQGRHFGGPSLVALKARDVSNQDLQDVISNGKNHMPKFAGKLATEEISTLVRQIKALNGR